MPTSVSLRIIILQIDLDIWCDFCGLPSAMVITYLIEEHGRLPEVVRRLTCCDSCDEERQDAR